MVDELEPGPDPKRVRDPRSRQPDPPERVPAVLRSYKEDQAFSIRRPTQAGALEVKSQITAAVYYLNRWVEDPATPGHNYDLRVRPYVTQHWEDSNGEHTVTADNPAPAGAKTYWKCNFWVHKPLPRGFRQMDRDKLAEAHQRSAETRAVEPARPRRSVARRPELRRLVQAARPVINQRPPGPALKVRGVLRYRTSSRPRPGVLISL